MTIELATIITFGLSNCGMLVFFLGGLRAEVKDQARRLDKLEMEVSVVRVDVGKLQGRAEAQS